MTGDRASTPELAAASRLYMDGCASLRLAAEAALRGDVVEAKRLSLVAADLLRHANALAAGRRAS